MSEPRSVVPRGWKRVRLNDVATLNPETVPVATPSDYEIDYVDITSVPSTGHLNRAARIRWSEAPSRARRKVSSGDILVSTVRPYLRAFVRVQEASAGLVASTGFAVIRPSEEADGEFIYQNVLSQGFVDHLVPRMTGTNYPSVAAEDVADFPLLLPPLGEQRRVAEILSSVDRAIERTEAVIEQARVMKQALAHELLTRGVPGRHSRYKQTDVGKIPDDWQAVRLGNVLARIEAGHSPLCEDRPAGSSEWGVLKVSSVSWGKFLPDENKALRAADAPDASVEVKAGDLLVSRANTPELVGQVVYVSETRPRLLLSDKTLRLVPDVDRVTSRFLSLALSSSTSRTRIERDATGSSRSMRNISQHSLRHVPVPMPPLAEQCEIVAATDAVEARATSEEQWMNSLHEAKASLMSALLTGRLRIGVSTNPLRRGEAKDGR